VGTSEIGQTTLRGILGQVDLDELLIKRDDSTSGRSRSSTS
jgi:regulator of protease activity HflC (stomatin/prohibitin superfamily)